VRFLVDVDFDPRDGAFPPQFAAGAQRQRYSNVNSTTELNRHPDIDVSYSEKKNSELEHHGEGYCLQVKTRFSGFACSRAAATGLLKESIPTYTMTPPPRLLESDYPGLMHPFRGNAVFAPVLKKVLPSRSATGIPSLYASSSDRSGRSP